MFNRQIKLIGHIIYVYGRLWFSVKSIAQYARCYGAGFINEEGMPEPATEVLLSHHDGNIILLPVSPEELTEIINTYYSEQS